MVAQRYNTRPFILRLRVWVQLVLRYIKQLSQVFKELSYQPEKSPMSYNRGRWFSMAFNCPWDECLIQLTRTQIMTKIMRCKTKNISDFMGADSAFVFTQLHPIWPTCFWVIVGWLGVGQRSVNFGRLLGIWNKKVERMVCLIQETTERIHELTAVTWAADEINNSLLATKNASLYHHSLDTPSCKNRMF